MCALLLLCLLLILRESIGYGSTPAPISIVPEIKRFGHIITPTPLSIIPFEGELWLFDHSYSSVYYLCEREVWLFEYSYSYVCYSC